MTTKFIILFLLSLLVAKYVESVTVTEVKAGNLAELPCLSSDDHHRFMFWQLSDDKNIIGPGNQLDQEKYNYEVLTGKLLIRVSQFLFFKLSIQIWKVRIVFNIT